MSKQEMVITTVSGWLKVQIELNDVPVGLVTTDDNQWHSYPIWDALTQEEKDFIAATILRMYRIGSVI